MSLEQSLSRADAYYETLQQGRRLLVDQILKGSQLELIDLSRFEFRYITQVQGWETDELEKGIMGEIGLISEGMVHIPVLAIVPKNCEAVRDGFANLRMQFEYWGGDGGIPRFSVGFVVGDIGQHLASTSSFDFIVPYMDNPDHCIGFRWEPTRDAHMYGRDPGKAFHIKLPTGWESLIDEKGMLRDESKLKNVASFMARRVDLSIQGLRQQDRDGYAYWHNAFMLPQAGYNTLLRYYNIYSFDTPTRLVLDDDIPVTVIRTMKNGTEEMNITVHTIQIYPPEPSQEVRELRHLVRPKENTAQGNLVIRLR